MVVGFGVEAVSKPHLTSNYGVAGLVAILTYAHVCCVFSSAHALYLDAIWGFETASKLRLQNPI